MMVNKKTLWLSVIIILMGVHQVEAGEKTFNNGRYYLKVGALGATPDASDYQYTMDPATRCIYHSGSEPTASYLVNLHMPDGHKIIGLNYEFYDSDSAGYTAAKIIRSDGTIPGSSHVIAVLSQGTYFGYSSEYEELITPHIIDNSRYQYVMQFYRINPTGQDDDLQMCQARVVLEPGQ